MNTRPCSECKSSVYSEFTNTLFCDERGSKNFLNDIAIYEKRKRGGALRQLTIIDCPFFDAKGGEL